MKKIFKKYIVFSLSIENFPEKKYTKKTPNDPPNFSIVMIDTVTQLKD